MKVHGSVVHRNSSKSAIIDGCCRELLPLAVIKTKLAEGLGDIDSLSSNQLTHSLMRFIVWVYLLSDDALLAEDVVPDLFGIMSMISVPFLNIIIDWLDSSNKEVDLAVQEPLAFFCTTLIPSCLAFFSHETIKRHAPIEEYAATLVKFIGLYYEIMDKGYNRLVSVLPPSDMACCIALVDELLKVTVYSQKWLLEAKRTGLDQHGSALQLEEDVKRLATLQHSLHKHSKASGSSQLKAKPDTKDYSHTDSSNTGMIGRDHLSADLKRREHLIHLARDTLHKDSTFLKHDQTAANNNHDFKEFLEELVKSASFQESAKMDYQNVINTIFPADKELDCPTASNMFKQILAYIQDCPVEEFREAENHLQMLSAIIEHRESLVKSPNEKQSNDQKLRNQMCSHNVVEVLSQLILREETHIRVFWKSIKLFIKLLEGGNRMVQDRWRSALQENVQDQERFFRALQKHLTQAMQALENSDIDADALELDPLVAAAHVVLCSVLPI